MLIEGYILKKRPYAPTWRQGTGEGDILKKNRKFIYDFGQLIKVIFWKKFFPQWIKINQTIMHKAVY